MYRQKYLHLWRWGFTSSGQPTRTLRQQVLQRLPTTDVQVFGGVARSTRGEGGAHATNPPQHDVLRVARRSQESRARGTRRGQGRRVD